MSTFCNIHNTLDFSDLQSGKENAFASAINVFQLRTEDAAPIMEQDN
jgi:hypothetical protein